MQSGSPDKLIFLGGHPGGKDMEELLHIKFYEYHSHGEWFNESSELFKYINSNTFQTIESCHDAESIICNDVVSAEKLLLMSKEEIREIYMQHLVLKLNN